MSGVEGTFPKTGGDDLYDSEINSMQYKSYDARKHTWFPIRGDNATAVNFLAIAHSSTAFSSTDTKSADGGITWTAGSMIGTWADHTKAKACDANRTKAIAWDKNAGKIRITSDSGANWADASTAPPNLTSISQLFFPTATRAVAFGTAGAGSSVWYSTDGGDTWAQGTGLTATAVANGCMFNATNGFAQDDNDTTLYITSNGGQTWSDSGQTTGSSLGDNAGVNWYAISSTEYMFVTYGLSIFKGSTSSTGELKMIKYTQGGFISNIVKTTNGNYYFVMYDGAISADVRDTWKVFLYKSKDAGDTWEYCVLDIFNYAVDMNVATIDEYDTNKLLIPLFYSVLLMDETYGDE